MYERLLNTYTLACAFWIEQVNWKQYKNTFILGQEKAWRRVSMPFLISNRSITFFLRHNNIEFYDYLKVWYDKEGFIAFISM